MTKSTRKPKYIENSFHSHATLDIKFLMGYIGPVKCPFRILSKTVFYWLLQIVGTCFLFKNLISHLLYN